jgi:hypothetical protein
VVLAKSRGGGGNGVLLRSSEGSASLSSTQATFQVLTVLELTEHLLKHFELDSYLCSIMSGGWCSRTVVLETEAQTKSQTLVSSSSGASLLSDALTLTH